MSAVDLILLAVLAAALVLAGRKVHRDRKQGKTCSGDCANCPGSCKEK